MKLKSFLATAGFLLGTKFVQPVVAVEPPTCLESCNVVWDSPGKDYKDSMPIGNGDIGLNVWTEQNGDFVFLIGKDDAWTENAQLVKLGRVRVKLSPNPFVGAKGFQQELKLREGEIQISDDAGDKMLVWLDVNHPVAHIEVQTKTPTDLLAGVELWRLQPRETLENGAELFGVGVFREWNNIPGGKITVDSDTNLPAQNNRLTWCHRNERSLYPLVFENQHLKSLLLKYPDPLLHRTFGVCLKGPGLVSVDNQTLKSAKPSMSQRLDLIALTQQTDTLEQWQQALDKLVAATDSVNVKAARRETQQWWNDFWQRSWIYVSGSPDAQKVTQGYALQRWMNACAGRGAMVMKYNGSIFTVGQEPSADAPYDPAKGEKNADYRNWGGNYWFQNTRLIYWPMIASGDFDLLSPFYKMYSDALPLAKERTKLIYGHEGAAFPETIFFWGLPNNNDYGWSNQGPDMQNRWIRWHVNNGLELTMMMLDTYETTQDENFAKGTLLPLANEITIWFDQHWKRADGKLHFEPSAALETRQWAVNPAPDIAGLKSVLPRLIALPETITTSAQRKLWRTMLAELPPLPRGRTDPQGKCPQTSEDASINGAEILWPAEKFQKPGNVENPELYSVHPFRLFGVGLPELDLARATYDAKLYKDSTCWGQQGIQAACLGWAERAKTEAIANFTDYGTERFKWFWKPGHDWEPDMDNGGAGQIILQSMLMQTRGDKVLLFPAWPKEWNVDFKLHAPKNTIIEGIYSDGKIQYVKITPKLRANDVIQMTPQ
jgi:alpha-L-fucosidase 2